MNMTTEANINNSEAIVINRMFKGSYLEENIGHEVINIFKSDNGKYYLYLNALGSFHSVWKGRIKYMLMVRQGVKMMEVIGLATGLKDVYKPELAEKASTLKTGLKNAEIKYCQPTLKDDQDDFIATNNITYDGVPLNKIFSNNRFQQDVNITFEAELVVKPKKPIFITFEANTSTQKKQTDTNIVWVNITGLNPARASLKQYIVNSGKTSNAYDTLLSLINNSELWDTGVGTVAESKDVLKDALKRAAAKTMFDICGIAYSELAYSNAIAYFFKKYPHHFTGFMIHELDVDFPITGRFDVKRELLNIDLLFTNGENSIVIENKITSGINGLDSHDPTVSQLEKYYHLLVKDEEKQPCKTSSKATIEDLRHRFPNPRFFVLTPNYNNVNLTRFTHGESYTKIHYRQLYDYLKKTEEYNNDYQFREYVDSLERHASPYDNELYVTTLQRFMDMIQASNA